jgi:hypothetical protein
MRDMDLLRRPAKKVHGHSVLETRGKKQAQPAPVYGSRKLSLEHKLQVAYTLDVHTP